MLTGGRDLFNYVSVLNSTKCLSRGNVDFFMVCITFIHSLSTVHYNTACLNPYRTNVENRVSS